MKLSDYKFDFMWMYPEDITVKNNLRVGKRHLPELMRSIEAIGIIDPIILDGKEAIAGGSRVIAVRELNKQNKTHNKLPCIVYHGLPENLKRIVAIESNTKVYPMAVNTIAVYIFNTINDIIKEINCTRNEAIVKYAEMSGNTETYIEYMLSNYRPNYQEAINADRKVEDIKRTHVTTTARLIDVSKALEIPLDKLEEHASNNKIARAKIDVLKTVGLDKIKNLPKADREAQYEKYLKIIDETVSTIQLPVLKTWKEPLCDMINKAMKKAFEEIFSDKLSGKELDYFLKKYKFL